MVHSLLFSSPSGSLDAFTEVTEAEVPRGHSCQGLVQPGYHRPHLPVCGAIEDAGPLVEGARGGGAPSQGTAFWIYCKNKGQGD